MPSPGHLAAAPLAVELRLLAARSGAGGERAIDRSGEYD